MLMVRRLPLSNPNMMYNDKNLEQMKKTYIFPKSIVIDLNGEEMLALSGNITEIQDPSDVGGDEDARVSTPSTNNLWDAEW